jgi:prevent-host-death family protein
MGGQIMTRVGMREFRTHLSAIVRRVRDNGETFEITRRGKPVAILRPMKPWEKKLSGFDKRADQPEPRGQ